MLKGVFIVFAGILVFSFCGSQEQSIKAEPGYYEIRGVSFVGMHYENEVHHVAQLDSLGVNWMSQMPYAFMRNGKPEIHFNHSRQWWGESARGIIATTVLARRYKINTLLKPQIWMGGEYTGKFKLASAEEWRSWEKDYEKFILFFARVADSMQHESFCIGTELQPSIVQNPAFWNHLIDTIRSFYSGKLTYASNWDEYRRVPFWQKLDWIGINAYFPLSPDKTPSVKKLLAGWKRVIPTMKDFSDSVQRPVVFTEIGYKSVDACAWEPWNPASKEYNLQAQQHAYYAFLAAFSKEKSWFKGYFLWKWYPDYRKTDGEFNLDYTPQQKPALEMVRRANGR